MNMKSKRNTIIKRVVIIAVVALLALDLFAGNYLVSFALSRASASGVAVAPTPTTSEDTQNTVTKVWETISKLTDEWADSAKKTVVSIKSGDGLDLVGDVFSTDTSSHGQSLYLNPDLYFDKVFSFIDSLKKDAT